MTKHTTNYYNTFIEVAPDYTKSESLVPPIKGDKQTVANIQFDMIRSQPYTFTSDDVIFNTFAVKNDIANSELVSEREKFFSKGQPCMRASPLTKSYGWGVHCNIDGKLALIGMETDAYEQFVNDESLEHVKAMRSKRG
ncbi:MAG: DUF6157 family protein [Saprospiraceae bacterium]